MHCWPLGFIHPRGLFYKETPMIDTNVKKWLEKRWQVIKHVETPELSQNNFLKNKYYKWENLIAAYYPSMKLYGLDIKIDKEWHDPSKSWQLIMSIIDEDTGHAERNSYTIINESKSNQGEGGSYTYGKRYMFSNLMALGCGEIDDDGEHGRQAIERQHKEELAETITNDQLEQLRHELKDHPDMVQQIYSYWKIPSLSAMPKSKFLPVLDRIHKLKNDMKMVKK